MNRLPRILTNIRSERLGLGYSSHSPQLSVNHLTSDGLREAGCPQGTNLDQGMHI